MPAKIFRYPFIASLHDIDAAGVMFFALYFQHAHDAYEAFMAEIGFSLPRLIRQGTLLPLVHSEADFLLPIRHGEQLTIEIQLERLGSASFTLGYRYLDSRERVAARLKTSHVTLNPEDWQPMALPRALHAVLTEYAA
ncbi:MAG: thioesterase family protein [Pseudomonadota bacterium]